MCDLCVSDLCNVKYFCDKLTFSTAAVVLFITDNMPAIQFENLCMGTSHH